MGRDAKVPQDIVKAHNSYLELGVPAAALLVVADAVLFPCCLTRARVCRRDTVYACVGVAATVIVEAHSAVAFRLQIPAVAATYALIVGIAVAQSLRSRA